MTAVAVVGFVLFGFFVAGAITALRWLHRTAAEERADEILRDAIDSVDDEGVHFP
jgi:hypothetical protein